MASDSFLDVAGAEKAFGTATVLGGVDLQVGAGEFVSLLGPSGCGKTTLLRIIAGLLAADRGAVRLDGEDISARPPHRRDVGVVFQNYALFPHLTVAENVAFGLKARRRPAGEIAPTVKRFLELVHLTEFAGRSVRALSGGQQQRVAVARALAVGPKLLLLDEPFSALDRKLRETMQIELRRLLRELGTTAVFVTHDQDEALTMSDRIAVMNRGAIEQLATPETVYRSPKTAFVLEFVGLSSRLAGRVVGALGDGMIAVDTSIGRISGRGSFVAGSDVLVAVRPERIGVGQAGDNSVRADLRDAVFQGSKQFAGRDRRLGRRPASARHDDAAWLVEGRHADLSGAATVSARSTKSSLPSPWRDPVILLAVPAVVYLLVVYAYPLLWLLMKSFTGPSGLTVQPYIAFMSDPFNWRVIGNTLRVAAWVTVVCFAIGYPAAFALARAGAVVQIVMLVSIILPLSIGAVVKAFAWQIVLRRDGIVSQLMLGLGLWDEPQRLLFTETGLVLGAANIFLPFMILPVYSVVKLIDPRLSEAGATLGATPLYRFTRVTLPLTLPGIVSGVAFVFSLSVSMFVIPSLLIGDRFQTLSTLTGRSFLLMRNEQLGSTTAVILLVLAVSIVVGSTWLARRLGGST